jgi:hypothetical protein
LGFWKLPSNKEIMEIQVDIDKIKEVNLTYLYDFEASEGKLNPNLKKNS